MFPGLRFTNSKSKNRYTKNNINSINPVISGYIVSKIETALMTNVTLIQGKQQQITKAFPDPSEQPADLRSSSPLC